MADLLYGVPTFLPAPQGRQAIIRESVAKETIVFKSEVVENCSIALEN